MLASNPLAPPTLTEHQSHQESAYFSLPMSQEALEAFPCLSAILVLASNQRTDRGK